MRVLTDAHPLDERLAGQLMLALYRAGRQAEALDHYQGMRQRLVTGLGADPGPALRDLHQRILTADPGLLVVKAVMTEPPVPRQLPAPPWMFSGRAAELAALDKSLDGVGHAVEVVAIAGAGGTGKTWLALHWAHTHADRFPGGQLYVDLRGFDPVEEPLSTAAAVGAFLHGLGVDPEAVPTDPQTRAGLYRSRVADRKLLIVLDNARDVAQVLPLLPGSPACMVLVTSRQQLRGLTATHGARLVELDVFEQVEANELLAGHLGHNRVATEPDAVAELIDHCGGLPLALSIVAAHAADPAVRLADLAGELREVTSRLDTLDAGDLTTNLRAVFSSSLQALAPETAELFGLLGSAPGTDIGRLAVASLAGVPRARALLRDLVTAHLVREHQPGRYRMHDLLKLYAVEHFEVAAEALRRLVDFYLHTAHRAEQILHPHRLPITVAPLVPGCQPQPLAGEEEALAWLETEHANVLAAQRLAATFEWHDRVWQLAWALDTFHRRRGHLDHQLAAWQAGLVACQRLADPGPLALAHRNVGIACVRADRHDEALDHLQRALSLTTDVGDVTNQAHNHLILAYAWERQGEDDRALEHATHALPLFEALGTPVWLAQANNQVARYAARLGHHEQARDHSRTALTLFRQHEDRDGEADTLSTLGHLAYQTGEHTQALSHYEQALHIRRDLGHAYGEADILAQLGEVHTALHQPDEARHAWTQAASLLTAQGRTAEARRVTTRLAG